MLSPENPNIGFRDSLRRPEECSWRFGCCVVRRGRAVDARRASKLDAWVTHPPHPVAALLAMLQSVSLNRTARPSLTPVNVAPRTSLVAGEGPSSATCSLAVNNLSFMPRLGP